MLRISVALETDIAGLFTPPSSPYAQGQSSGRRAVTRAGEGELVKTSVGNYHYLAFELLNKNSVPIVIDVTAKSLKDFGDYNRHPGEELLFVIEGELDLYTNLYSPANLKKGDSIYFDSNMGHAYIAVGDLPCRVLSVCIPPTLEGLELIESKPPRDAARRSKPG